MDLDSTLTGPVVHEPFGRSLPKGLGSLCFLPTMLQNDVENPDMTCWIISAGFLGLARKQHAEIGHRDTWDELQEPGGYSCLEKMRVNREIGSWIMLNFWVCRSWKPFLQTWSVRKNAAKIFTAQVVKIAEKERLTQKDVNVEFR